MRRLLDEPGLMARLSGEARRSHKGRYSFEGSMDAWAEALDACLRLPLARGAVPVIPSRTDGRLARLGLGPRAQEFIRGLAGRRARHASPGSEWPTASGTLSEATRQALDGLARAFDEEAA